MRKNWLLPIICAGVSSCITTDALAQGLDFLHAQRFEGRRICMSDHFHYGSSTGQPSRKAAQAVAAASWADFTGTEYGPEWGSWRLAASRGANCKLEATGWSCSVEARPCKPAPRSVRRTR